MNPLSFIPAPWLIWLRIAIVVLLAGLCFGAGWEVNGWRLGTDLQALKTEHEKTVADAYKAAQAVQHKLDAEHEALASNLAAQSAAAYEDLRRNEHANQSLRADVASGARVVRVAAACPAHSGDVPQAAPGGRLDPAAGAVLAPDAGQRVLDLRAGIIQQEHQLAACQQAVKAITGQGQ